jgi:hypothetical protein
MVVVDMSPTPSKVIGKEIYLRTKGHGLSKDHGPKCIQTFERGRNKKK